MSFYLACPWGYKLIGSGSTNIFNGNESVLIEIDGINK